MRTIDVDTQKELVKDILRYVHDICNKNGIRYFAAYGTALGAVRHHGFIPWDDDGDIEVPFPDYEKLREIINHDDSPYRFMSFGDEGYYYSYGKIVDTRTRCSSNKRSRQISGLGVSIDVFPLLGLKKETLKKEFTELQILKRIGSNYGNDSVKKRKNILMYLSDELQLIRCRKSGIEPWGRKLQDLVRNKPFDKGEVIFSYGGLYKERQLFDPKIYDGYQLMDFEDFKVRVPKDWDGYLTGMYGDWRKPPEEKNRVYSHDFNVYWNDEQE